MKFLQFLLSTWKCVLCSLRASQCDEFVQIKRQIKKNCSDPIVSADTTSNQALSPWAFDWIIGVETWKQYLVALFRSLNQTIRAFSPIISVETKTVTTSGRQFQCPRNVTSQSFTQRTGMLQRESWIHFRTIVHQRHWSVKTRVLFNFETLFEGWHIFVLLRAVQVELLLFNNLHNSSGAPNRCLEYFKVKQHAPHENKKYKNQK